MAESAEVDSALVLHYFSSKEGLFRAVIEWPFDMNERVREVLKGDPSRMGERLVSMVCQAWDNEQMRSPLTVVFRNAVQGEETSRIAADFVKRELIDRIVAWSSDPAARLRGTLVYSTMLGLVTARYVVRVEPLASLSSDQVVELVAPTVQRYLTCDLGSGFVSGDAD